MYTAVTRAYDMSDPGRGKRVVESSHSIMRSHAAFFTRKDAQIKRFVPSDGPPPFAVLNAGALVVMILLLLFVVMVLSRMLVVTTLSLALVVMTPTR